MEQKDLLAEFVLKKRKSTYSILSVVFFATTVSLLVFLFSEVPSQIIVREGFPSISKTVIISLYISCLAGMVTSIMSIVKDEKPTGLKIIGASLNAMTFLLLVSLVLFPIMMR